MNTNFLDSDQKQEQLKIKDHKKKFSNHFDDENKENNNNASNLAFKANIPSIKFERVSLLSDSSEDVIKKFEIKLFFKIGTDKENREKVFIKRVIRVSLFICII